jgi:hypothetical protein
LKIGDTADYKSALRPKEPPLAESVTQTIRIEQSSRWQRLKSAGKRKRARCCRCCSSQRWSRGLPFQRTRLLVQAPVDSRPAQQLLAQESGVFTVEVQYQVQVTKKDAESGFVLPTQHGLINQLKLDLVNTDVDVTSPHAVSIQRENVGSNTVARLVLAPSITCGLPGDRAAAT